MTLVRSLPLPVLVATPGGFVSMGSTPPPVVAAAPVFDTIVFFTGSTHGTGRLHVILHRTRSTDVVGIGTTDGRDRIVLRQRVSIDGSTPTIREWRLSRTSPVTYFGTLTDATGRVTATASGNLLRSALR